MSLTTEKLTSLGINLCNDVITLQNRTSPSEVPKVKKTADKKISEIDELRQRHELSRRESLGAAAGLLQVKEIINDLEGIAKGRDRDNFLGFRSSKETTAEDLLIGQVATTISEVLKIYPSQQNIQAAMGFIEMVNLIDELEDVARNGKGEQMGFRPSVFEEHPLKKEATIYANELKAKIPYLLEWIEVPEYMLAMTPGNN